MAICIDPGHGGKDPGAVSLDGETNESDIVLSVGHDISSRLGNAPMTRTADVFIELSERANIANRSNSDMLSVHCNAGGGTGFEIFTSPGQTKSDEWATLVFNAVMDEFPDMKMRKDTSDGDVDKEGNFTVLTNTHGPAILVELAFMDTDTDIAFLRDQAMLDRMVNAIVRGTEEFNDIPPSSPAPPPEEEKPVEPTLEDHEARIAALEIQMANFLS